MLILTRKPGESIYIGDSIKVTFVESRGGQARIGIYAPPETPIYREELYEQILEENRKAAEAATGGSTEMPNLDGLQWKGKSSSTGKLGGLVVSKKRKNKESDDNG